MLFNSFEFIFFFATVFVIYYAVPNTIKKYVLLLSNLFFFIYSTCWLALVPIGVCVITYLFSFIISKTTKKEFVFIVGIVFLLFPLLFYKYASVLNYIFHTSIGMKGFGLIAPIGISYITFQAIGYLIEIKRGTYLLEKNIVTFSNYLLFFSKSMSGPVEPAKKMLPQFHETLNFNYPTIVEGLRLIVWGLFKKIVIAENLATKTNQIFENSSNYDGKSLLLCMMYSAIQLYVDFSAYTDMARGTAKMLGIHLSINFNSPFSSTSITEFWRRWHMSLSTWFNTYLFSPLTVATRNWRQAGILFSLLITFLLIGLWHGASLNFAFFGLLHGAIICIEMLLQKTRKKLKKKYSYVMNYGGMVYTFLFFSMSLLLFHTNTIHDFFEYLKNICIHFNSGSQTFTLILENFVLLIPIFILFAVEYCINNNVLVVLFNQNKALRFSTYIAIIVFIIFMGIFHSQNEFIYLKF